MAAGTSGIADPVEAVGLIASHAALLKAVVGVVSVLGNAMDVARARLRVAVTRRCPSFASGSGSCTSASSGLGVSGPPSASP